MTELVWDGKYDSNGNKTAPLRVSLPFQTVETVNESAQQRQIALDLFSAAKLSISLSLPMADSVILATARALGATFWTQDEHFKDIEGVRYIAKKK